LDEFLSKPCEGRREEGAGAGAAQRGGGGEGARGS